MLGIKYIHTHKHTYQGQCTQSTNQSSEKQTGKLAIIKYCENSFLSHHGAKNGAQKRNTNPEESEVFWRK